jgi:sterol desaturase/sphingolipid hydroxylase (fatty acid hydroxylase superfamily)
MIFIEFSMSHAVILNLYYFAYSMRSVKDTLESKSPDDLRKRQWKTKIMGTLNIALHLLFVMAASCIFMFIQLFDNSEDYEQNCKKLDNLDFSNPARISLFVLQCLVFVCEMFVLVLFTRFFIYFTQKKFETMRQQS